MELSTSKKQLYFNIYPKYHEKELFYPNVYFRYNGSTRISLCVCIHFFYVTLENTNTENWGLTSRMWFSCLNTDSEKDSALHVGHEYPVVIISWLE